MKSSESDKKFHELETLPNIDINIKCGNSLISRYSLDTELKDVFKGGNKKQNDLTVENYKNMVKLYKETNDRQAKAHALEIIKQIKNKFSIELDARFNPKKREFNKLTSQQIAYTQSGAMFKLTEEQEKEKEEKLKKISEKVEKLEKEIEKEESGEIYRNAFEWRFEFPEVLDEEGNYIGFNVVIGNPPYISLHNDDYYTRKYKTGKCRETFAYFFELGYVILSKEGILTLITSSLYIKGLKFEPLRIFLLENVSDLQVEVKGDNVFDEAKIPTAITFFNKQKPETIKDWELLITNNPICKKILKNGVKLGKITKIQRGLEIGRNKTKDTKTDYPIITGSDIIKYAIKKIRYIEDGVYKKYIKTDLRYYKSERVLIRETGSDITCIYESEFLLSNRTLYSILPLKNYETKYLIGLLNSKCIQYFYENQFRADTEIFPKIRIAQVHEIPIPKVNLTKQKPIINLVNQILKAKEEDPEADTSNVEAEIDRLVYKLYDLTDEEIKIVEGE